MLRTTTYTLTTVPALSRLLCPMACLANDRDKAQPERITVRAIADSQQLKVDLHSRSVSPDLKEVRSQRRQILIITLSYFSPRSEPRLAIEPVGQYTTAF